MASHIKTERLVLRPLTAQDSSALVRGLSEFEVSKWLAAVAHPYLPTDADEFLEWAKDQWPCVAAITLDGNLIGCIDTTSDSIGYWLSAPHWNRGIATEAARAMAAQYFANTDQPVLGSGYFVGNTGSANVLAKLGFSQTGRSRLNCEARGQTIEHINVALPREVWEAIN